MSPDASRSEGEMNERAPKVDTNKPEVTAGAFMSDVRVEVGQMWRGRSTGIAVEVVGQSSDRWLTLSEHGNAGYVLKSDGFHDYCWRLLSSPPPEPAPIRPQAGQTWRGKENPACLFTVERVVDEDAFGTADFGDGPFPLKLPVFDGWCECWKLEASAPSAQQCPDCGVASAPGTQAHALTCPRVTLSAQQPAPKIPAPPTGSVPRAPDCRVQERERLALTRWRAMHPDQPDGPSAAMLTVKMWRP